LGSVLVAWGLAFAMTFVLRVLFSGSYAPVATAKQPDSCV
jgi:hypothetical protein